MTTSLDDLFKQHSTPEKKLCLDELFELIIESANEHEKELLLDAYITNFGECHYDYMCHKFNDPVLIALLLDDLDKILILDPEFDSYHFYRGHVYEMLSSESVEHADKIKYALLSLGHLRKQHERNSEDPTLLIDLAQAVFTICKLTQDFSKNKLTEMKNFLLRATVMERKEEHQNSFFGFNGSGIYAFLNISYEFLTLPFTDKKTTHNEFISTFSNCITPYCEKDPLIYYHWIDTLLNITRWVDAPMMEKSNIDDSTIESIWTKAGELARKLDYVQTDNEFINTSIGHLFTNIGRKKQETYYHDVALTYYLQAVKINRKTWSNPSYACDALKELALLALSKKDKSSALAYFEQGIEILKASQEVFEDFQLTERLAEQYLDIALFIEDCNNKETLELAKKEVLKSIELAGEHFDQPTLLYLKVLYYADDKTVLRNEMERCCTRFSSEYHVYDFTRAKDIDLHKLIEADIPEIMEKVKTALNITPYEG